MPKATRSGEPIRMRSDKAQSANREVTPESVTTFSLGDAERKVVSGGGECAAYGVRARAPVKVFAGTTRD